MRRGFTLAELLIALAILGVIATFTIPKVLQSQQDGKYKAMAKEVVSSFSAAYDAYGKKVGAVPTTMTLDSLSPYLNYVSVITTGSLDDHPSVDNAYDCNDATLRCLKMHNGGMVVYRTDVSFGGNANVSSVFFLFDPDSVRKGGTADAPSKSVSFVMYYNGRITTRATVIPGTIDSRIFGYGPDPATDPSWFSWN